jgi:(E)-4-hydroxy-3-methylbut-2-enyl-diphosphate synthase
LTIDDSRFNAAGFATWTNNVTFAADQIRYRMQFYCERLTEYRRLRTREVNVGSLLLGNNHPIRIQTMTTTDTMDTLGTVEQTIRCIEAGAELVRITAPSKKEAENLLNIKNELHRRGYKTPLVADIHFTPNAAEIAARIVEKVRVNPGNYVDKKKFELIEYSDAEYLEEIERIRDRFTPLVRICKDYGTAMRIGTNHGSLSDRIMSRYGDTPMGMVESAMEFLRIARGEQYHNIVLSMKSSNPQVMVQAYRLLVKTMQDEFGEAYPLHLGVTEAGDGEDGRIKSAIGIGTLLEDGLGDTIRVSLTEDPEAEVPVCRDLVKRYDRRAVQSTVHGPQSTNKGPRMEDASQERAANPGTASGLEAHLNLNETSVVSGPSTVDSPTSRLPYNPFAYKRRETFAIGNIGGNQVPVVVADFGRVARIEPADLQSIGYTYDKDSDKWTIADMAADYVFTGNQLIRFALPGTLKVIVYPAAWEEGLQRSAEFGEVALKDFREKYFPIFQDSGYISAKAKSSVMNFVMMDCFSNDDIPAMEVPTVADLDFIDPTVVLCLSSTHAHTMPAVRRMFVELANRGIRNPAILITDSYWQTPDEHLIHYSAEAGALLLEGMGDGVCFGMTAESYKLQSSGDEGPQSTVDSPQSTVHGPRTTEDTPELPSSLDTAPPNSQFLIPNSQLTIDDSRFTASSVSVSGRNYQQHQTVEQFINNTAFSILQATRTRISKTEYISCPSCGRTLFDLQETTARIRAVTNHLKGVKIAIMGCIVNGPGEMADADFGYVGSGPGKITLYKGKDVVKRNVSSEVAVEELIGLLKDNGAWTEPR